MSEQDENFAGVGNNIDPVVSNTIENRIGGGFAVVFSNGWEPEEFENWDDLVTYLEDCYLPYDECQKRKLNREKS